MKQSILRLFTCLILGVVFGTTAWAQSAEIGKNISLSYSDGSFNIPTTNFNSSAKSIKVFFDFGETALTWGSIAYNRYNAMDPETNLLTLSASRRYYTIIVTQSDIISKIASSTGISVNYGDARTIKVIITNYDTADGAANDKSEASGIDPNAGSSTGTTPTPSTKTLAEKIAAREQLTNLATVYFDIPDAVGKDINSVLTKDRKNNIAEYHQTTIQVVENGCNDGTGRPLGNFTEAGLEIKVRGNSTSEMDKRPYRLRFYKDEKDDAGNVTASHKHDMLGYGYSKRNWTILNNMRDGSLMQNAITYYIGQAVGMPFCPGYKFVDLVINGEYRGNYMLSDHVEVGKNRIDIDETNGWFVESTRHDMTEEPYFHDAVLYVLIKNPESKTEAGTAEIKEMIRQYFVNINNSLFGIHTSGCDDETFRDPVRGWRSVFDEETLVKFYIGTNLTGDGDGLMQVKMYREPNGKMHFGPLWDKDLAFGVQGGESLCEGESSNYGADEFCNYIKKIRDTDPVFVKKVHDKLHDMLDNGYIDNLMTEIGKLETSLLESKTLEYNNTGWKATSVENYPVAVENLRQYIKDHTKYFTDYIDAKYAEWVEIMGGEIIDNTIGIDDDDDDDDDDTPVGDLGALVDLDNGKYSYTGSASTFKEGTEITITTSTASTTLNNYITEGTAWNTTKTITLTASDVTTLAANSYTFYMNATGGEVKAVNVKAPVASAGAEFNKEYTSSYETTSFNVPASNFNANATSIKVIIDWGNTNGAWTSVGFSNNAWDNDVRIDWTTSRTSEFTITDASDIAKVASSGITFNYGNDKRTVTITVINYGSNSGSSTTPTYTLALSASEGGSVIGAGTYAEGTTVLIKAIPNTGYKFVRWSDDNTYASRSVTLKEALTLTATFAAEGSADEDLFNEHGARKQFTNLPTIYLDATVGNEWSTASLEVFDKDNKLGQGTSWTSSAVETQYQGSGDKNKDSYRLKFGSKTQLLSSGKFKQWVLLANDDDPTMMRNALAKEMGDALSLPFTPGYQFVDLYVNNEYKGTYQVTDRIKVESGRALVTGGDKENDWHVRLNDEGEYNEDKPTYYIAGTTTSPYIIPKNPDPKDDVTTWNSTLKGEMTTYFNNVFAKDASGKYTAFAENVDHQQLIEWYIAQEMLGVYKGFSSIEAYRSVAATDKNLHIGILWDSEKAFGNTGLAPAIDMSDLNANTYNGLMTNYAAYDVMKNIFTQLWQERWFANGVNNLWKEKHETMLAAMTTKATALKTELEGSWAQNATKWNITGEQATSINAMTSWLTQRDAYLTKKFAALAAAVPCETHTYENHNYIEQTNGTFLIGCDVCGTIKEGSETYYKFTVYPESATTTEVFATSWQPSDEHPNSIAVVEAEKKIVEKIEGWNIVCGKKSTLSDGTKGLTCKDFRLTDGHPYYSDNKFVATTATYTRPLAENEVYGMMTLPFKHQNAENADAAFYHIASVENGKIQLVAIDPSIDGNASAYLPVIFKRKADAASITVTGTDITVKKTSANKFNSTLEGWTITGAVENTSVTADGLYKLSDAKLGKVAKAESLTIAPFRAYLSTTATDTPTTLTFVCPGVTVTTLVDAIKQLTSGNLTKQDIDNIVEELLNKE